MFGSSPGAAAAGVGALPGSPLESGTGGVVETSALPRGSVVVWAAAEAGRPSARVSSRAAIARVIGTGRTLDADAGGARAIALRYRRAVLTDVQAERLTACARVLSAPARIVMTGNVVPDALAAMQAGAAEGVGVVVLPSGEIDGVEGSIDVLFMGPASPYSAAVDMFQRWPARVVPGGTLFVHGAFAFPPLTAALLRTIGSSRGWRYFDRDGALAEYVRADLSHGERVLDAFAQAAQLPWFARGLARRRLQH